MDVDSGHRPRFHRETLFELIDIGKFSHRNAFPYRRSQLGFATVIMGQSQKLYRDSACLPPREKFNSELKTTPVLLPGKQLITVNQIHKRPRLAPKRMNHVMIIDRVSRFLRRPSSPALKGKQMTVSQVQRYSLIVKTRLHKVTDKT